MSVLGVGLCPSWGGWVSDQGGLCPGGSVQGVSILRVSVQGGLCLEGDLPPPVNRMIDASKNITLSQTSFARGNKRTHHHGHYIWIHGSYFCHDPGMSVLQSYQFPWAVRVRSRAVAKAILS